MSRSTRSFASTCFLRNCWAVVSCVFDVYSFHTTRTFVATPHAARRNRCNTHPKNLELRPPTLPPPPARATLIIGPESTPSSIPLRSAAMVVLVERAFCEEGTSNRVSLGN